MGFHSTHPPAWSNKFRRLCRTTILTASALTLLYTLSVPPSRAEALQPPQPTATIVDPASGQKLIVSNNGDCSRVSVQQEPISAAGFNDQGITHTLDYTVDKTCHIVMTSGSSGPTTRRAFAVAGTSTSSTGTMPGVVNGAPATPNGVIFGNVIHGSQTLLDVVGITVARYQYSHDRVWDNIGYSYFKWDWWMTQDVSVSWNHNVGSPVMYNYDSAWTFNQAHGVGAASFHSDFLWCNFQAGQNFKEYNVLYSNWNGTYSAQFSDSTLCSGLHHATRVAADTTLGNIW